MPFDRTGTQPFEFDPVKLGTVKPELAEAEGYTLSADELRSVFGIDAKRFAKLPKRMIIPVLTGKWYFENGYHVTGYLYVVEPQAWVPQVSHGETLPASVFKTTYTKETETVTESKFNAGASAEINFEGGGTYFGVTASVKSNNDISFTYSSSTVTKETLQTQGISGDVPIHQLFVYPTLRCKVIRKQRIKYTIHDSSDWLEWSNDSNNEGYWPDRWVADNRLDEIRKLQLHPVPMVGNGLGHKAYILPVPEVTRDGDLKVTTIMSRSGWQDWYVYDIDWETANQTITLSAPHNDVAFRPMSTWAIFSS